MSVADKLITIANNTPLVCERLYTEKTVSGNPIVIGDVSSVKHDLDVKVTSDDIIDFSGVEIKRYGKNLFDINNIVQYPSRNDYANHPVRRVEDLLTFEGRRTHYNSNLLPLPKGKIIYVSGEVVGDDTFNMNVVRTSADGTSFDNLTPYHYNITGEFIYKFTIPNDEYKYGLNIYSSHAYNSSNGMKNFQISFFSDGIYESYKEIQTATVGTDRTVEGLTSLSPNMTLLADNTVNIECTYKSGSNPTANEKFIELQEAFASVKEILKT